MLLVQSSRRSPRIVPTVSSILILLLVAAGALLRAQTTAPEGAGSKLTVPQAAIGTDVKEREIVGSGSQFPSSVGRLYCLTKIVGAADPTHVTHLWFHEDTEVHKVDLPVNGTSWRTWSYKTIPPGWTGKWRVDVQDANGVVIYSIPFTISEQAAGAEEQPSASPGQQESH